MAPFGVVIETERLRLRSLRADDLADLIALIGNWEVTRWVSSVPYPYSEADGREWIAKVQQDHATGHPQRFAIALTETDASSAVWALTVARATKPTNPHSVTGSGRFIGPRGMGAKQSPLSSTTGSAPSALRRYVLTLTRATRLRKGFSCIAAS